MATSAWTPVDDATDTSAWTPVDAAPAPAATGAGMDMSQVAGAPAGTPSPGGRPSGAIVQPMGVAATIDHLAATSNLGNPDKPGQNPYAPQIVSQRRQLAAQQDGEDLQAREQAAGQITGASNIVEGVKNIAQTGIVQSPYPGAARPLPSPAQVEQAKTGAVQLMQGAGQAGMMIAPSEFALATPLAKIKMLALFGSGAAASDAAGKATKALGFSQSSQDLASTLGWFIPGTLAMGAGLQAGDGVAGKGKGFGVSAFPDKDNPGGRIKVAGTVGPEGVGVGYKTGDNPTKFVRIGRDRADAATAAASPAAPQGNLPPGMEDGHFTQPVASDLARAINTLPLDQQGAATLEAHQKLTAWITSQKKIVTPDGNVAIVDSTKKAQDLATKILNTELQKHKDAEQAAADEAAAATEKAKTAAGSSAEKPAAKAATPAATTKSSPEATPPVVSADTAAWTPVDKDATPPVGEKDPVSGRKVLQPTDDPTEAQKLATAGHPEVKAQLDSILKPIDGATIQGDRPTKAVERLAGKIDGTDGEKAQPASTIPDYSGFRIAVDTPEAKGQAVAAIKKQFNVVNERDEFESGANDTGFHAHMMQVEGPNGATHEVQILPKEVAENADANHGLYKAFREGTTDGSQLKTTNQADYQGFLDRNAKENSTSGANGASEQSAAGSNDSAAGTKPKDKAPVLVKGDDGKWKVAKIGGGAMTDRGARSRLIDLDGKKYPSVSDDQMVQMVKPHIPAARYGTDFERNAAKHLSENWQQMTHDYLQKFTLPSGVVELNTDAAKEMFPDYQKTPTEANSSVQGAAGALADSIHAALKAGEVDPEHPWVRITAGSPSAGKSANFTEAEKATMNSDAYRIEKVPKASAKLIKDVQAEIDAGRNPVMDYFYVNDFRETVKRAIKRAQRTGRTVPIGYMEKAWSDIPKIIQETQAHFGDKLQVRAFDNSGKPGEEIRHTDAEDAVKQTEAYKAKFDPLEEGLDELHHAYQDGRLSESLYHEFTNDLPHRRIRALGSEESANEDGRGSESVPGQVRGGNDRGSKETPGGLRAGSLEPEGKSADAASDSSQSKGRDNQPAGDDARGNKSDVPLVDTDTRPGHISAESAAEGEHTAVGPKDIDGSIVKPGKAGDMKVSDLSLDPNRFQYKLKTDATGVTDLLKGKKWNPDLTGILSVWHDPADGKTYVVNGHHRFTLARENGVDAVTVRVLHAKTAEDARATGALQNIADGRGTPVDAAKFMRDMHMNAAQMSEKGISLKEATAAKAVALSRLSDKLFNQVVQGDLRENRAVKIGEVTDDPTRQDAMVKWIDDEEKKGHDITDKMLADFNRLAEGAGEHTETQNDLFGMFEQKKSNIFEKLSLMGHVRDMLAKEKRDFSRISDDAAAQRLAKGKNKINAKNNARIAKTAAQMIELHDKLSVGGGPIDDIYTQGARDLSGLKGGGPTAVKARVYEAVRAELGKYLDAAGEEREPEPATAAADDKAGTGNNVSGRGRTQGTGSEAEGGQESEPSGTEDDSVKKPSLFKRADTIESPTFYRKSEKLIDEKMKGPMPAEGVRKMLENAGIKAEEMKWTGLDDALKPGEKVTPQQLKDVFAQERVKLNEKTLGAPNNARLKEVEEEQMRLFNEVKYSPVFDDFYNATSLDNQRAAIEKARTPEERANLARLAELMEESEQLRYHGAARDQNTKFSSYQEPGGTNYREMLMTLPDQESAATTAKYTDLQKRLRAATDAVSSARDAHDLAGTEESRQAYRDAINERGRIDAQLSAMSRERSQAKFQSSHWDEPNVLAHTRYNDRTTPDGKKLLHLEEVQSDWHQQGRDKGYAESGSSHEARLQAIKDRYKAGQGAYEAADREVTRIRMELGRQAENGGDAQTRNELSKQYDAAKQKLKELDQSQTAITNEYNALDRKGAGVPDAPFKKTWHEMALRRMLRHAAENGYDGMSWTPGEKQNARYDLSKQVDSLSYNPESQRLVATKDGSVVYNDVHSPDKLGDVVGKEAARKLLDAPISNQLGLKAHRLSGQELSIGGSGMKGFYDKIVPDYLNKYGKKWGAKVSDVELPLPEQLVEKEPGQYGYPAEPPTFTAQHIPITPEMRKSVMEEGQPLFAKTAKGKSNGAKPLAEETLARAMRHEVIPAEGKLAPMLKVDSFARELLNRVSPLLAGEEGWKGVTLAPHDVDDMQAGLQALDKTFPEGSPQSLAVRDLSLNLGRSQDRAGSAILIGRGEEGSIGEEQFHGGQLRHNAHLGDILLQIGQSPELLKAKDHLAGKGYPNNIETAALEGTAKVVNGDWAGAGLTKAEGATLVRDFLAAIEKARGPEAFKDLQGLADEIEQARARNGISEGQGTESSPGPSQGARAEQNGLDFGPGGESFQGGPELFGPEGAHYERSGQRSLFNKGDSATRDARAEADSVSAKEAGRPLDDLVDRMKAMKGRKMSAGEHMADSIERAVADVSTKASGLQKMFAGTKGAMAGVLSAYKEPPVWSDFKDALGDKNVQTTEAALQAHKFVDEIKRVAPTPLEREGLTNWLQADGNTDVLRKRETLTQDKNLKAGYTAALRMTAEHKDLGMRIKGYFDDMLKQAQDNGLLTLGARNYVSQAYESDAAAKLNSLIDFAELNPDPSFIKKRIFQSYFDAEQENFKPKTKDVGHLLSNYHDSFAKAIASRTFIRRLIDGKASDGRPLAVLDTAGEILHYDAKDQVQLLARRPTPGTMTDYKTVDSPQLRNFNYELDQQQADEMDPRLFEDDSQTHAFKGNLKLHPEIASRVENMVKQGLLESSTIGKGLAKVSSGLKHTLLSLSAFHYVTVAERAAEHWVNPFKQAPLDINDPVQRDLVRHGLNVADFSAEGVFSTKVLSGALEPIPGLNKFGDVLHSFETHLFQTYIPKLKMAVAKEAFAANTKKYKNLSRDQVMEITAKQANATFGGLNHDFDRFARDNNVQYGMRMTLLAPDFLESNLKMYGQAFSRYGHQQRLSMLRGAAMVFAGTALVNMIFNHGDPMKKSWKDWDSMVIGGKRISIRTPLGDMTHLAADPRQFIANRANPMTTRPFIEFMTGRDAQGRQKSAVSMAGDYAKGVVPLPFQKGLQNPESGWMDSVISAMGLNLGIYRTPAAEMAHQLYIKNIPDMKEDEDHEAQSRTNAQLIKKMREGKTDPTEVWNMVSDGKLTAHQAGMITKRGSITQLEDDAGHLNLAQLVDIYAKANPMEKQLLIPEIAKKQRDLNDPMKVKPSDRAKVEAASEKALEENN